MIVPLHVVLLVSLFVHCSCFIILGRSDTFGYCSNEKSFGTLDDLRISHERKNIWKLTINGFLCSVFTFFALSADAVTTPLSIPATYNQQIPFNISIKTVRGVWRIRETIGTNAESVKRGRVIFKGFVDEPLKGTALYTSADGRTNGKGFWRLKPGPVAGGQILFSARWKISTKEDGAFLYKGNVQLDSNEILRSRGPPHPDAHIRGDVFRPIVGSTGSLSEKKVGTFEADLLEVDADEEKL